MTELGGSGREEIFKNFVTGRADSEYSTQVQKVDCVDEQIKILLETSNVISFTSTIIAKNRGFKVVPLQWKDRVLNPGREQVLSGLYPMTRELYLVRRVNSPLSVIQFIDFVQSPQGQKILEDEGVISILGADYAQ